MRKTTPTSDGGEVVDAVVAVGGLHCAAVRDDV